MSNSLYLIDYLDSDDKIKSLVFRYNGDYENISNVFNRLNETNIFRYKKIIDITHLTKLLIDRMKDDMEVYVHISNACKRFIYFNDVFNKWCCKFSFKPMMNILNFVELKTTNVYMIGNKQYKNFSNEDKMNWFKFNIKMWTGCENVNTILFNYTTAKGETAFEELLNLISNETPTIISIDSMVDLTKLRHLLLDRIASNPLVKVIINDDNIYPVTLKNNEIIISDRINYG